MHWEHYAAVPAPDGASLLVHEPRSWLERAVTLVSGRERGRL